MKQRHRGGRDIPRSWLSIPLRMKQSNTISHDHLQLCLSIPLRMKPSWCRSNPWASVRTFNSFEDETSIRLPTRVSGWRTPFNSFEDETSPHLFFHLLPPRLSIPLRMKRDEGLPSECLEVKRLPPRLSIPLRMKQAKCWDGGGVVDNYFQFLWGWNGINLFSEYLFTKSW